MNQVKNSRQVLVDETTYSVDAVRNGGMGRVWLLNKTFASEFDPIYRNKIAVKTFDFMDNQDEILKELNIWISMNHDSILPLLKIGRLNYRLGAIMPLLSGSLDDILDNGVVFKENAIASMLLALVSGLNYAWSSFKILHLDLKPSNILIANRSPLELKIADWGVSRLAKSDSSKIAIHKESGHVDGKYKTAYSAGTPLFMSPERFSGQWTPSPSVDIYSLGLIAIQLNSGILPFRFGNIDPIEEIFSGAYFKNAMQLLSGSSVEFREFCLGCIHPSITLRTSTYAEAYQLLASILRKGG